MTRTQQHILLFAFIALIGVGFARFGTSWGSIRNTDPVSYVSAARNLLAGNGFTVQVDPRGTMPLTHFPPLWPLAIAAIGKFGIDALLASWWANAILFGLNIFLSAYITYRFTSDSIWPALLVALLMLFSTALLPLHTEPLSEPIFIFLCFLGLFCLARYVDHGSIPYLVAASVSIALAFLARYVGGVLIVAAVIAILFLMKAKLATKIKASLVVIVISVLPIVLFSTQSISKGANPTDRTIAFHPITLDVVQQGVYYVSTWFLLDSFATPLKALGLLIILGLLIAAVVYGLRRGSFPGQARNALAILALFVVAYLGFLVVSISFIDSGTALNDRILAPVFFALLVAIVCLLYWALEGITLSTTLKVIVGVVVVVFLVVNAYRQIQFITTPQDSQPGAFRTVWANSEIAEKIKALPPDSVIFAYDSLLVDILTGRSAISMLKVFDAPDPQYDMDTINAVKAQYGDRSVFVYLNYRTFTAKLPSADELAAQFHLTLQTEAADGGIYTFDK